MPKSRSSPLKLWFPRCNLRPAIILLPKRDGDGRGESHAANSQSGRCRVAHSFAQRARTRAREYETVGTASGQLGLGGWQRKFCAAEYVEHQGGDQWPNEHRDGGGLQTASALCAASDVGF